MPPCAMSEGTIHNPTYCAVSWRVADIRGGCIRAVVMAKPFRGDLIVITVRGQGAIACYGNRAPMLGTLQRKSATAPSDRTPKTGLRECPAFWFRNDVPATRPVPRGILAVAWCDGNNDDRARRKTNGPCRDADFEG